MFDSLINMLITVSSRHGWASIYVLSVWKYGCLESLPSRIAVNNVIVWQAIIIVNNAKSLFVIHNILQISKYLLSILLGKIYNKDKGLIWIKQIHHELYKQLGLKISYYRKLKGLSQEQLAEKLGINASFLGAVEAPNVSRTVSLDTLFDIADILEISPHKFIMFEAD